jgi:hypothetical protein
MQVLCPLSWLPSELLSILQHPSQAVLSLTQCPLSFLRMLLHIGQLTEMGYFHLLVDGPPSDCDLPGAECDK